GRMLETGGAPPGLGPFLRSAPVTEGAGGEVRIRLPAGPLLERLRDPGTLSQLAHGLAGQLGRAPRLVLDADEAPADRRITLESVRRDRLRELLAKEPLLERAVEELDLELLD